MLFCKRLWGGAIMFIFNHVIPVGPRWYLSSLCYSIA